MYDIHYVVFMEMENGLKMKAYTYYNYGSPEVLHLEEVKRPIPEAHEVLIQTYSLSINPSELHKLTASFWMLRLSTGLSRPKNQILGADVAGTVISTGPNVKKFKAGDRVFGRSLYGCLAECCCIDESALASIPDNLSFEEAAALPLAAVTALIALRDKGKVQSKQHVLINGASGGIGTFAIQLGKYFGAHITGVSSSENVDFVKSLGADQVVDYKKQDLQTVSTKFDLVIDLVGNRKISTLKKLLKPSGKCILVGMDSPKRLFSNMIQGKIISALGTKKVMPMDAKVTAANLSKVAKLVSEGKIKSFVSKCYNFENVPEAFFQLATRRSKGKIIIRVDSK